MKDRRTVNTVIALAVFIHLASVMLASRFQTAGLYQFALYSGLALYFVFGPFFWFWHRVTLADRPDEGLSDIRKKAGEEQLPQYAPEQYFDAQRGVFMGMEGETPIYLDWANFRRTHMQIVGTTGSGKGVASCMLLAQCALAGECVVVFDPKDDEFAPGVMARAAKNAGIPFYSLDLRPSAPPQLNLLRNANVDEVEEILITGFDLGEKGDKTDFYRLHDRAAARDVCQRAGASPTFALLVDQAQRTRKIDSEKGVKFKADLEELASLPVINTNEGLDLESVFQQPGILYIIGSIRNTRTIRMQKMVLLRIMQILEKRERKPGMMPVAIMLDELKYILSAPALQALATVRDKSCHVLIAHQSLQDLRDCGGIDPLAVTGAVVENTALKLIYKANSPETADWAAKLSGTIIRQSRTAQIQQGMFEAAEGTYVEKEQPLFHTNDLLTLPKGVGMFYGDGLCKRVQVAALQNGPRQPVVPAPALQTQKIQAQGNKPKKEPQPPQQQQKPAGAQRPQTQTQQPQAGPPAQTTADSSKEQKPATPKQEEMPGDINVEHSL